MKFPEYIYLIGVGGIGMSALARYFNAKSKKVYGYDRNKSTMCMMLEDEGITIHYNEEVNGIPDLIRNIECNQVLVIYTPAVSKNNLVLNFFLNRGHKLYKRAEVLGEISKQVFTIAVAGTHGKTTTAAILTHIFQNTGNRITSFLGGISKNYNTNLLLSDEADVLIVEADEYDRSFLYLEPDIAVITSIDSDHLDIYKNKGSLLQAFKDFSCKVKDKGLLLIEESVLNDFLNIGEVAKLSYSVLKKADYYADNIKVKDGRMIFNIQSINSSIDNSKYFDLVLPGIHNISNAVAAITIAIYLGVAYKKIISSISTFTGIDRRFDVHINNKNLVYVDDYAHHPKEVSSTIRAAMELFPERGITVVFQPHLFSRTKDLAYDFAESLSLANQLILLDIYPARESPIEGVDSNMLLDLCHNPKKETCSKAELLSILEKEKLDVLLTLGAGDIDSLVEPIKHLLN